MTPVIDLCARAVIIKSGSILLCKSKGKSYYFFPGGHIEANEAAAAALRRELTEELGVSIKNAQFIGAVENFYAEDGQNIHEINLVFKAELNETGELVSREAHLEFSYQPLSDLANLTILPVTLKDSLVTWLKDKKTFWASNG